MSKKVKKGHKNYQPTTTEKIIFATAILNLIKILLEIFEKLFD